MKRLIKKAVPFIFAGCILPAVNSCTVDGTCYFRLDDFEIKVWDKTALPEWTSAEVLGTDSLYLCIDMHHSLVEKHYSCYAAYVREPVNSITVTTLYDYSADFPAGSDITPLFSVQEHGGKYDDGHFIEYDYLTVDELVKQLSDKSDSSFRDNFLLRLTDHTCAGGVQNFGVILKRSDGVVLEHQTDDLQIRSLPATIEVTSKTSK
jgi:hypothetical protein